MMSAKRQVSQKFACAYLEMYTFIENKDNSLRNYLQLNSLFY